MKLGIYSDVHVVNKSSIMPYHSMDSKYSVRLQMIIDTFKWMYDVFETENVDIICNCGDLFDSHTVRAEELNAVSDCYRYSKGTREIHIVGNHEIFDNNRNFYSTAMLKNFPFIEVYDEPQKIDDTISILPYMRTKEITDKLLKSLSNKVLLSHIDIMGSHLRADYIMDTGVNCELLSDYFDMTINGHLHTAEKLPTTKNDVWNIGSVTSLSFADNSNYIPSVCIYDTETYNLKRINNPYAILFRKIHANSTKDIINKINELNIKNKHNFSVNNGQYKYILDVSVPYEIKDKIKDVIDNYDNIISSKVVISNKTQFTINNKVDHIDSVRDMKTEFIKFLDSTDKALKYPSNLFNVVLQDVED